MKKRRSVQEALDALTKAQDRHSEAMATFEHEQADAIARGYFPRSYHVAKKEAVLSQRWLEAKSADYRSAQHEEAAPTLDLEL